MDAHELVKWIFKTASEDYIDNGYWISIYCSEPKIYDNIDIRDYLEMLSSEIGIDLSKYKKDKLYAIYDDEKGYYKYWGDDGFGDFIEYFGSREDAEKAAEILNKYTEDNYKVREEHRDNYLVKIEELFDEDGNGKDVFITAYVDVSAAQDSLMDTFSDHVDY